MVDPRSQTNKKSKMRPLKRHPNPPLLVLTLKFSSKAISHKAWHPVLPFRCFKTFPFYPSYPFIFRPSIGGYWGVTLKNHPYVAIRKSSTSMTLGSHCEFFGVCIMLLAISVASKKAKSHLSNGTKSSGRLTFYTDGFYRDTYDGL